MTHTDSKSNAFDDLGKVLFLAMDDILREHDLPPINSRATNWEDLTPERQEFFRNTAKRHFAKMWIGKPGVLKINGRDVDVKEVADWQEELRKQGQS